MFMGQDGFIWWVGVIEDNADPLRLGRARVRIFGYHAPYKAFEASTTNDADQNRTPIDELPWAVVVMPANLPDVFGLPRLGDWVLGFFLDGREAQEPAILGYIPGMASQTDFSKNSSLTKNFSDERTIAFGHLGGSFIKMTKDEIFVESRGGTYPLIDHLNWITNETHTTTGGSKRGPRNFTIGRRRPPPPPAPSGGGGGVCFTQDSMVTMFTGRKRKISEVQPGDFVLSRDRKNVNKVRFVEISNGKNHKYLYSPDTKIKPFATLDHPLYIDNKLCAVNPKYTKELYPWLDEIQKMEKYLLEENDNDKVYNLWVDGDGTYIINDYETTSIIYDGGMLSDFYERGYFSDEYIRKLYDEYTTKGNELLQGAFILNNIVGKLQFKPLLDLVAYAAKSNYNSLKRKLIVNLPMKVFGFLFNVTSKYHKWRFIKK